MTAIAEITYALSRCIGRRTLKESTITQQVSIIVIAFNEEGRIGPCLDALLKQETTVPFEVVVVDDGSRDSTVGVVEELLPAFPHLRLLRLEFNQGRGAARRYGQDATDSPWVGFVDADIVVPSNWLDRCLMELAELDGVSGIAQPDGDCAVIWRLCKPSIRQRPGSAEITGNNVVFSRSALDRVAFSPHAKLGEDFRLAKIMTREGLRLRTLEDLKVQHRETKTFLKSIVWMWHSGVDATSLLFEFRVVRLPDLAWLAWMLVLVAAFVVDGFGAIGLLRSIVVIAAMTLFVSGLFIFSRFKVRPHLLRFLAALLINPPTMLSYLLGRTAGLFLAPHHLIQRQRSSPV
jgi:glycosyltransferase involved in cell wall biosynthesis